MFLKDLIITIFLTQTMINNFITNFIYNHQYNIIETFKILKPEEAVII